MKTADQTEGSRFTPIAYSLGLAIIFSATVLNLCLHKLEPKHLYALPSFVVEPYEQAGAMGVTLVLAGLGLFIMFLGYVSSQLYGRTTRTGGQTTPEPGAETAYSDPRISVPTTSTSSSGSMALETTKYLGKKPSALPGSTVFVEKNQQA
jgi:hypothetical protein